MTIWKKTMNDNKEINPGFKTFDANLDPTHDMEARYRSMQFKKDAEVAWAEKVITAHIQEHADVLAETYHSLQEEIAQLKVQLLCRELRKERDLLKEKLAYRTSNER